MAKLTWVEIKLFAREPITVIFTLALPFMFLFVMGGIFGNAPDPAVFRGVDATNYYTPAYIGLVIASIGVVALPVHITGYRERGVLRRLRASALPLWSMLGSQVIVSFVIALLGGILLTIMALFVYHVSLPESPALFIVAFVASVLSFTAVGIFLGAVLPTTRAAQGVGLLLFFVMLLVGGAGPPQEAMTESMRQVGEATPLRHVILLLQDPWLGFGWNTGEFLIITAIMVAASLLAVRFFRWE